MGRTPALLDDANAELQFNTVVAHSTMAPQTSVPETVPPTAAHLTLESWSQGFMIGALVIMAGITVANMRKKVLLHKLIFLEASISLHKYLVSASNH